METLLSEAINRLVAVGRSLGYQEPDLGQRSPGTVERVDALNATLQPLTLPQDLVDFWTTGTLLHNELLDNHDIGIYDPDQAQQQLDEIRSLEFPKILLPILGTCMTSIYALELDGPSQPGSRLFYIDFDGETSLVGVGVADLLNLFADTLTLGEQRSRSQFPNRPIDWTSHSHVTARAQSDYGNTDVDTYDKGSWPPHWLAAEGFDTDWLKPKGPTHTVAAFDRARQLHPLSGVLEGRWQTRASAGSHGGVIGHLTDDSGSIQVWQPNGIPNAGMGADNHCEIEVIGDAPTGNSTTTLRSIYDNLDLVITGDETDRSRWFDHLLETLTSLDISVAATAVRPISR